MPDGFECEPDPMPDPPFEGAKTKAELFETISAAIDIDMAPPPPAAEPSLAAPVPMPSAFDVLERAGIDVESHPRGPLDWARAEHTVLLEEWCKKVPLNEIVVRLDKARIAGTLPTNPNGMLAFERIALGEV